MTTSGPNSAKPTTGQPVAGTYNAAGEVLVDGQASTLQVDVNGNLLVNVAVTAGGGAPTNVNIADVKGAPPALSNPLPVELSDGTNALGVPANPLSVTVVTGATPVNENIAQWGGTAVLAAQTSATTGTGADPEVRAIQRKFTDVFTTTPLAANASFTSAWIDTQQTGESFVTVESQSNVNGAVLQIQETDDTVAGAVRVLTTQNVPSGTQTAYIGARYWRVLYTNGATLQTTFELTATGSINGPVLLQSGNGYALAQGGSAGIINGRLSAPMVVVGASSGVGNQGALNIIIQSNGSGAFAADAVVQYAVTDGTTGGQASAIRTPNKFFTVQATASGNTALWTPTSGKKFRVMRYKMSVTGNATLAAGAVLTITLEDSSTALAFVEDVYVPATTFAVGSDYIGPWVDLGNGFLSAAANQVLNVNLSSALTAGNVRVVCCGTEE